MNMVEKMCGRLLCITCVFHFFSASVFPKLSRHNKYFPDSPKCFPDKSSECEGMCVCVSHVGIWKLKLYPLVKC